jgi:hypothetical protein
MSVRKDNVAILIIATFQEKLPEASIFSASLIQNETQK